MKHLTAFLIVTVAAATAHAFALRGPLTPWMTTNLSYGLYGDAGGPLELEHEYRWNLPTLTYGFDQSFIDFFGERGVQAVEEAIAILNDLPPASALDVNAFPYNTKFVNFELQVLGLADLKSLALSVLIEELGLADPERYIWTLRERAVVGTITNYLVIQRNYDPISLEASRFVNGVEYVYQILEFGQSRMADAIEFAIDPLASAWNSVAGRNLLAGEFLTGLTYDDAGGWRYLYHPTNVNIEPLLPGVTAANLHSITDVAPRPGVDKITFARMQWDASRPGFQVITNVFTDTYLSNGLPVQQTLQRVLDQPDITFRARDLGLEFFYYAAADAYTVWSPLYNVSGGVSSWVNNAALNGQPGGAGPGTIPARRAVDFSTSGRYLYARLGSPNSSYGNALASFDQSTNAPVRYGVDDLATSATIESRIVNGSFVWKILGTYQAIYRIDSTTNFVDWLPVATVTNTQGHFSVTNPVAGPRQFYRAVRTYVPSE